ncbi:MAG: hypothetical protein KGZ58_01795 [Ignavibacteriales bacterium]|nr:hypothetical protein [Ignavibacteriales bacterium]
MDLLGWFSSGSILFPFLSGIVTKSKQDKPLKLLNAFFIVSFIAECLGTYYARSGINNLWMITLFTPIEFTFLMSILSYYNPPFQKVLRGTIIPFLILFILINYFFEDIKHFNIYSRPLESILLTLGSAHTLFFTIQKKPLTFYAMPPFWVCIAIIVFFAGNIVIFALANWTLSLPKPNAVFFSSIYMVFNILGNILFALAFWSPLFGKQSLEMAKEEERD